MTYRSKGDYVATNIDFLLMFVAAIRAVVPGFSIEARLPLHGLRHAEVSRQEIAQASLNSSSNWSPKERLEFQSGIDLWTWVMNRYEAMAVLVYSLSEEQRATVQQLLDGMLQEIRLVNLAESASRH